MAKSDLLKRTDQRTPIRNGELVPVTGVVQVTSLIVSGPYVGDFQITHGGRLIIGDSPDSGPRLIASNHGLFGFSSNGSNSFSLYTSNVSTYTAGDLSLGNLAANFLLYEQATGTLGLYTPQGAGFIARRDGTLQAGHADGAHMLWDAGIGALQIRSGGSDTPIKAQIGADGDAWFEGTIYASGGRIYGTMVVDDVLRVGDVDGPALYLGKFVRESATLGTIETAEIIATDEHNLPWLHVVAGGETLPGYLHLGRTGDYASYLDYDGTTVTHDGTLISAAGKFVADSTGLQFTESTGTYWRLKPQAQYFMELTSDQDVTYNTLRVNEANGIAGYFSGGYVGVFARSTTDQIGVWGYTLAAPSTPGTIPSTDSVDPDKTDGIEALTPGVSIYGLTETGTAGRFVATDGGRGVVAKTTSTDQPAMLAWNTSTGPALTVTGNAYLGDGGTTNYAKFSATGVLTFAGSAYAVPRWAVTSKTADYTAQASDSVIVCNKATAMTITLPAATGSGKWLAIGSIGAGAVTVDANGSETIDGQTTRALAQWDTVQIVDYAAGTWKVI